MNHLTILGSGTSQGIPVIACHCEVCASSDSRDKRLRSSVLFHIEGKNYVIDSGPDFRQQMLRENIQDLEALIFTHEHKDHVAGMDDVRAFNFKHKKDMPIYAEERVLEALKREFAYVFSDNPYPGIPSVQTNLITNNPFQIGAITFEPIRVLHHQLPVLGFRYKNVAYVTDAKTIPEKEKDKLKNLDVLILNALRLEEHISHFSLAQALELIVEVQPKKAYLTHISHLLGTHEKITKLLPANVEMAFDGLQIYIP